MDIHSIKGGDGYKNFSNHIKMGKDRYLSHYLIEEDGFKYLCIYNDVNDSWNIYPVDAYFAKPLMDGYTLRYMVVNDPITEDRFTNLFISTPDNEKVTMLNISTWEPSLIDSYGVIIYTPNISQGMTCMYEYHRNTVLENILHYNTTTRDNDTILTLYLLDNYIALRKGKNDILHKDDEHYGCLRTYVDWTNLAKFAGVQKDGMINVSVDGFLYTLNPFNGSVLPSDYAPKNNLNTAIRNYLIREITYNPNGELCKAIIGLVHSEIIKHIPSK